MLFFKRILNTGQKEEPQDRRGAPRYAVSSRFPLKVIFNAVGRDEQGIPLKDRDGEGWDWSGRLINLSSTGAQMQVPPTVTAIRGDACRMKFDLEGFQLLVPGHVAHIIERRDSYLYGLALNTREEIVGSAYQQLLEVVAVSATIKPVGPPQADETGYMSEQYEGDYSSRLGIWRAAGGTRIVAFHFQFKDCHVRGQADEAAPIYLMGTDLTDLQPASTTQSAEIQRLFRWVAPCLNKEVPVDVREFLVKYAV